MSHLLDNAIWNALNSGNKSLAKGTDDVKYYSPSVSPFAGMEVMSPENFLTLYEITPDDDAFYCISSIGETEIPKPWTVEHCIPCLQMVCDRFVEVKSSAEPLVWLSDEHIPQMVALTKLTNPGPFRERTIEMGHYQGIFDGDRLVAMAGQRMHPTPYAEISAVCTHPDYTGRGYAAQLISSQIKRIRLAGEVPFLHVANYNARAIKLYEAMGFVKRAEPFVYFMKK